MWYAQIVNSLQIDDFSEELLQDITQNLQTITSSDFHKGYEIIIDELLDQGHLYIIEHQLPSCQLIIDYLQFWNKEICPFSCNWGLQNLEITYLITTNRNKNLLSRIQSLIDEQQFYSIGITPDNLYQSAYSIFLFCTLQKQCKKQAVQAILKLQQLIIKNLDFKLNKKIHILMAQIYEKMGQLEGGKFEANQYFEQAYKTAAQVLNENDPQLQHYYDNIIQDIPNSKPPKPLTFMNSQQHDLIVLLEEKDIVINELVGKLDVFFNNKSKELIIKFNRFQHNFNLSDILNEIQIYGMSPLPVFLQEFVQKISKNLDIQDDHLIILIEILTLESYEKIIQIMRKNNNESFIYFTNQMISRQNSEFLPLLSQDDEGTVHPLLSDKNYAKN